MENFQNIFEYKLVLEHITHIGKLHSERKKNGEKTVIIQEILIKFPGNNII